MQHTGDQAPNPLPPRHDGPGFLAPLPPPAAPRPHTGLLAGAAALVVALLVGTVALASLLGRGGQTPAAAPIPPTTPPGPTTPTPSASGPAPTPPPSRPAGLVTVVTLTSAHVLLPKGVTVPAGTTSVDRQFRFTPDLAVATYTPRTGVVAADPDASVREEVARRAKQAGVVGVPSDFDCRTGSIKGGPTRATRIGPNPAARQTLTCTDTKGRHLQGEADMIVDTGGHQHDFAYWGTPSSFARHRSTMDTLMASLRAD